jgi:hypothetical protein
MGSVVREAQRSAIGMLRRLVLGLSFSWDMGERGRKEFCLCAVEYTDSGTH